MRALLCIAVLGSALLASGCGDSSPSEPKPPEPQPGWLRIRLNSPNADDGGVMFRVSGARIDSIRSVYPDLFVAPGGASPLRVVVAGNLANGSVLAEIKVPDVQDVAEYAATVDQVASRATFQQRPASAFTLVVER